MNQTVFDTELPDALTRSQFRLAALAEMLPEAESLVEHPDPAHASRLALRTAEAVDVLAVGLLKIHRS
ncbi:hypothetical protein G3I76_66020, partial [Streptomyces sp. SID11233]|nr:hypothetical protein [Streptomyces sp. SID11233]